MMYKHILVAIDDSETSAKALDEAIALARLHDAVLQAFSNHGVTLVDHGKMQDALLDGGRETLKTAMETARAAGLTPRERFLAAEDLHAADQIALAVEKSGADLLVVGSHGRRGFRRMLLGSVAENLVRKVHVSVLIVRGEH
jgi:nucleotide-binding universal stress UspA family protein